MFQRLRRRLKLDQLRPTDVVVIGLLVIGLLVVIHDIVEWIRRTP